MQHHWLVRMMWQQLRLQLLQRAVKDEILRVLKPASHQAKKPMSRFAHLSEHMVTGLIQVEAVTVRKFDGLRRVPRYGLATFRHGLRCSRVSPVRSNRPSLSSKARLPITI